MYFFHFFLNNKISKPSKKHVSHNVCTKLFIRAVVTASPAHLYAFADLRDEHEKSILICLLKKDGHMFIALLTLNRK